MKNEIKHALRIIANAASLWWGDWVNQVMVSLVAIIASLTVILAPAAIFGIMTETSDLIRGTRTGITGWWKGFKANFWISLLWGSSALFGLAIFALNIWFYFNIDAFWAPLMAGIFIILTLIWVVMQFYTLGFLFIQEKKNLFQAWKNSLLTMLAAPFFTLLFGLVAILISAISLGVLLPLMVGTPALIALMVSLAVRDRLEAFGKLPPQDLE